MKVGHSHWPEMGQSEQYWDKSNNGLKCWELIGLLGRVLQNQLPHLKNLSIVLDLKKKKRTVSQENRIVGARMSVFIEVFS